MDIRLLMVLTGLALAGPVGAQSITVTGAVQDSVTSSPFSVLVSQGGSGPIIPANRTYPWKPGVTYNGGIPHRTTIYKTLSPLGGSSDDTPQIQAALDGCPANQVVFLNVGTYNINGNGLSFKSSYCTLRGSGPGNGGVHGSITSSGVYTVPFSPQGTGTFLRKADRATNPSYEIMSVGNDPSQFSSSINLAADGVQGSHSVTLASNPGIQVGEIVLLDINTDSDPDVVWGPSHDPPGGGSRRWFVRQDRSINQILKVTAVSGNVLTFETPLNFAFPTAHQAQVSRYAQAWTHGLGIEDIYFYGGMGGDWHGNLAVNQCDSCWVKHVEAHYVVGTSIGFYGTYRSELRDSYIHETASPDPGGGGYLTGLNYGASENLFENNIMWNGNKEIVMRGTGGGNVIAYNYMDDAFGSSYPESPEAGVNAGHYTTPHMELLEGNYSQNYKGDSYWGNSIYITVFRNWLTSKRAAAPPLATYTYVSGGCNYKYGDYTSRTAVDVQAYNFNTNFVGNILGMQNQVLYGYNSNSCFDSTEIGWNYENLANFLPTNTVPMWQIGSYQATVNTTGNWSWVANTYQTQLRQGNWDWVTATQTWYPGSGIGGSGSPGTGTPQAIPNSLYLTQAPTFFCSGTWPWVDPSTGATHTLPAKARFDAGTSNMLPC